MNKPVRELIKVVGDSEDLRDRDYEPTLRRLPDRKELPSYFQQRVPGGDLVYLVRDQGTGGTCTGQALAALIDIQRHGTTEQNVLPSVSEIMLYEMARKQGGVVEGDGVSSLRTLIKGFYHYGVCSAATWNDENKNVDPPALTVTCAREAKEITLGAYYRVNPLLNDYHAALNEADAILVSALTHTGWRERSVRANNGEIKSIGVTDEGAHAFVIVGYTAEGFLILNSWGPGWGGFEGYPGVALWRYEDWAERIMDAWVLRQGVRTPDAFAQSVGSKGVSFDFGAIRASSSACHQLLGHFAHLDDGKHVTVGNYASDRGSVNRTAHLLKNEPRPVVLSLTGSLLNLKQAFEIQVRQRPVVAAAGMYPYSVFWCNDAVESGNEILTHLFGSAFARVGRGAENLDDVIERTTRGFGRAYWRDVRRAADLAGAHKSGELDPGALGGATVRDGAIAHLLGNFSATGADLHLVVDGAGILPLVAYLDSSFSNTEDADGRARRKRFTDSVASLTFIAPTIEPADFARSLEDLVDAVSARHAKGVSLWSPSESLDSKLQVDVYTKSILDLLLYGFEAKPRETEEVKPKGKGRAYRRLKHVYLGMSHKRTDIVRRIAGDPKLGKMNIKSIAQTKAERPHYAQQDVIFDLDCQRAVLANIRRIQNDLDKRGR